MDYVNPIRQKTRDRGLRRPLGQRPTVGPDWEVEPLPDHPSFLRAYGGRIALSWTMSATLSIVLWLPAFVALLRDYPLSYARYSWDAVIGVTLIYFGPVALSVLSLLAPLHFYRRHRAMRRITDAASGDGE